MTFHSTTRFKYSRVGLSRSAPFGDRPGHFTTDEYGKDNLRWVLWLGGLRDAWPARLARRAAILRQAALRARVESQRSGLGPDRDKGWKPVQPRNARLELEPARVEFRAYGYVDRAVRRD